MDTPRAVLQHAIGGFRLSQMIFVAATLRLADHLAGGPLPVGRLAALTSTHPDSLYRLLRTLAGFGIFAEDDTQTFRLTPPAEYLRSDVPGSLRVAADVVGRDWMWRSWGGLLHAVQTGETAFDHLYGESTWDWFATHPDAADLFDRYMESVTSPDTEAIVAAFDFAPFPVVVDVAGGRGALLMAILRQHQSHRGILFNLPRVIESAREQMSADIAPRMALVGGDFFAAIPDGGRLYILKNILHDWNDDHAARILRTCRTSMPADATLLIIEHLVCGPNQTCPGKIGDMQMLVRVGGRNRTERELRSLLQASGFDLTRVIPTGSGPDLVEAVPTAAYTRPSDSPSRTY